MQEEDMRLAPKDSHVAAPEAYRMVIGNEDIYINWTAILFLLNLWIEDSVDQIALGFLSYIGVAIAKKVTGIQMQNVKSVFSTTC